MAALAATATLRVSGTALAQVINGPPLLPQEITVFPERDFTSISGFAPNADLLAQVRRNGVMASDANIFSVGGLLLPQCAELENQHHFFLKTS